MNVLFPAILFLSVALSSGIFFEFAHADTFGYASSSDSGRAASDNPTTGTCVGRTYSAGDSNLDINYGAVSFCSIPWIEFDVSTIPDGVTSISSATVRYDIDAESNASHICVLRELDTQPVNGQTTYDEGLSGDKITSATTDCQIVDNDYTFSLSVTGMADLKSKINSGQDWYAFSFFVDDVTSPDGSTVDSMNWELEVVYSVITPADAVTVLDATLIDWNQVDLDWDAPALNGGNLSDGYQIRYVTPWGLPTTIITNDTGDSDTESSVIGLSEATPYSFSVSAWTEGGVNFTGAKILNVTTLEDFSLANFTVGSFDVNVTNSDITSMLFEREDINSTALLLNIVYPDSYLLGCNFDYEFANFNQTYLSIPRTTVSADNVESSFQFNNVDNEIIDVYCWDRTNPQNNGVYIITQTDFPLLQQIEAFRSGDYGTEGDIGVIDFITLIVIIISMIGLNRVNESVGAIFSIVILGSLAYFGIIELPTIIFGAIAVVLMLVITSTRKQ